MTVWMVMPSAAPLAQAKLCVMTWKAQKYRVAIACEDDRTVGADWVLPQAEYPGYANSVNKLVKAILEFDPDAAAVVAAADDLFPDPSRTAGQIAHDLYNRHGGMFVVQGIADPWTLGTSEVPQSARVAGSPWLSRAWCERGYLGNGPLWGEYWHSFVDNDLAEVSAKLGVMRWDSAIGHRHEHFLRHGRPVPAYSAHAYARFADDQAIFERRKAAGFPDSDLLP